MNATFGVVLAGGESRRFGVPKALADFKGRAMVRWVADTLQEVATCSVLVGGSDRVAAAAGLPSIPDLYPGLGPLGGIHAGLSWLASRGGVGMLVVSCDTPLVSAELLAEVRGDGASARMIEATGRVHPLCGYYRVEILPEVERRIMRRELSLQDLVRALSIDTLAAERCFGSARMARELTNINTQNQLRAARECAD